MNNCTMCGEPIPDGQSVCSMCYGDIGYGNDGYYEQWGREFDRRALEKQHAEEEQIRRQQENDR